MGHTVVIGVGVVAPGRGSASHAASALSTAANRIAWLRRAAVCDFARDLRRIQRLHLRRDVASTRAHMRAMSSV